MRTFRLHGMMLCLVAVGQLTGLSVAQASTLFGVTGGTSEPQILVTIDTDTLTVSVIGAIGFGRVGGLAFGNDETLFGVSTSTNELITIDTITGSGTSLGSTG